jgi:8-amino-7-oxononanoate synthase
MIIDHLPSRTLKYQGEEYLFFSGTSYLGMGHQAAFRQSLLEGMAHYGTIFSASRNNNLKLAIYEEAENFIAHWTGAEAALSVTSGLLAGQLAVKTLEKTSFIYAPSVHPAIWGSHFNNESIFTNFIDFKDKIAALVSNSKMPITICCNAIDPLYCEEYDFDWILQLPENQEITIILDDSHGIGVTYTEGGGIMQRLRDLNIFQLKPQLKIIVIASLAKALGIPGGVILSDKNTIKTIQNNPLFVGASPIIPAYLYAFLKSQNVYQTARERLLYNIAYFKTACQKNNIPDTFFRFLPDYPIFYTNDSRLYSVLLKHKILMSNFAYPLPSSPPITRIILSALHTEGDIDGLVSTIDSEKFSY